MPAPPRSPVSAVITATGLCRERGGHVVLDDVSVTIGPTTCLGVVGPNGVGKTTLLRILAGIEPADGGRVDRAPPTASVGYLTQERAGDDETVDAALARRSGVRDAEVALDRATAALAERTPGSDAEYVDALERWQAIDAAGAPQRIRSVLDGLGLPERVLTQATGTLSGGQAARVALAGVLLSRFDVTLLDEPTNDLDDAGLALLEEFVRNRTGGVVIVSHDRAFLDETIDAVLEIDEHDHTAAEFHGGWTAYLEERATRRRHRERAHSDYVRRRSDLDDRAQRERGWATTGADRQKKSAPDGDKMGRDFRVNRTERLAARARRTEKAIERLDVVDKPWEGWDLRFAIEESGRGGDVVARLAGVEVERGAFTLGPVDLEIGWGDRVGLAGRNGSGKSTLIDVVLGHGPPTRGTTWLGPGVVPGWLGQHRVAFAGADRLLDGFVAVTGLGQAEARSTLAKFGLTAGHVLRAPGSLSPGERTRAELAVFQATGVNFLVLDEPTNHLDLPAVEQLESAIGGFGGTLLLVTHDRRFRDAVAVTRTLALEVVGDPSGITGTDRSVLTHR